MKILELLWIRRNNKSKAFEKNSVLWRFWTFFLCLAGDVIFHFIKESMCSAKCVDCTQAEGLPHQIYYSSQIRLLGNLLTPLLWDFDLKVDGRSVKAVYLMGVSRWEAW